MPATLPQRRASDHLERFEMARPQMAKADLKKVEMPWREQVGSAVARCFSLAGVSQKEASGLIGREQSQIARWISGGERPQLDALFAVEQFRQPLVQAFAELAGVGVEVETVVRIRRRA